MRTTITVNGHKIKIGQTLTKKQLKYIMTKRKKVKRKVPKKRPVVRRKRRIVRKKLLLGPINPSTLSGVSNIGQSNAAIQAAAQAAALEQERTNGPKKETQEVKETKAHIVELATEIKGLLQHQKEAQKLIEQAKPDGGMYLIPDNNGRMMQITYEGMEVLRDEYFKLQNEIKQKTEDLQDLKFDLDSAKQEL